MKKRWNVLCLSLATLCWGLSIVSQALGNNFMGPYAFNTARFTVGVIAMIPCLAFIAARARAEGRPSPAADRPLLLKAGIITGTALFLSINFQQIGLLTVPAGKAVFICALYMLMVPAVNFFRGRPAGIWLWLGIAAAVAGMYLLCMEDSFSFSKGELICLASAAGYTFHIMCLDHYTPRLDVFFFTTVQFAVVAVLSAVMMFLFENPSLSGIISGWAPVCYSGIISGSVAYSLQALGQKNFDPSAAALLLSMETVYGTLGAWLILGERMTPLEVTGCLLMFGAVFLSQMPCSVRTRKAAVRG